MKPESTPMVPPWALGTSWVCACPPRWSSASNSSTSYLRCSRYAAVSPATPLSMTAMRSPVISTPALRGRAGCRLDGPGTNPRRRGERIPDMPNSTAHRLASFAGKLLGGQLPVALRTWDGTRAGPVDAPTVVLRNRRALRRLLYAPGELGLARAYVSGDLDVEGDLADGFRRIWALTRTGDLNRVKLGPRSWWEAAALAARLGVIGLPPKPPAEEARL